MGAYGWTCAVTCGYDAMLVHFELGFWRILSLEGVGITGAIQEREASGRIWIERKAWIDP